MTISASIIVFKHSKFLIGRLVKSLLENGATKVYILDNSNNQLTKKVRKSYEYHSLGKNCGFGKGHNYLQNLATNNKFHFVVNPDIEIKTKNILKILALELSKRNNAIIIAPKLLYFSGELQESIRKFPSIHGLFLRKFFKKKYDKLKLDYDISSIKSVTKVDSVSGAFFAISNKDYSKLKGFDKIYFMYLEDIDFCRNANELGDILYFPNMEVYHGYEKASSKSLKLLLIHIISAIKYFLKWKL